MALFDRETDPAKERDGVPLDFGDFRVTLRRAGGANDAYGLEVDRLLKPYRTQLRHGSISLTKVTEVTREAFARCCVAKWETRGSTLKGVPSNAGNGALEKPPEGWVRGIDMRGVLVPDTVENLIALFTALPGVFADVQDAAKAEELFRLEQREDAAGN